jgi:hypothetical protein
MERTKLFSVLRIGAATLCFLLCLLTLGFWVRSYFRDDMLVIGVTQQRGSAFFSAKGAVFALFENFDVDGFAYPSWHVESHVAGEPSWRPSDSTTLGFLLRGNLKYHGILLAAPHWFVAFATGGMGVALLFRWFRRFTVRMLLIVTTICAVTLGLMVH